MEKSQNLRYWPYNNEKIRFPCIVYRALVPSIIIYPKDKYLLILTAQGQVAGPMSANAPIIQ